MNPGLLALTIILQRVAFEHTVQVQAVGAALQSQDGTAPGRRAMGNRGAWGGLRGGSAKAPSLGCGLGAPLIDAREDLERVGLADDRVHSGVGPDPHLQVAEGTAVGVARHATDLDGDVGPEADQEPAPVGDVGLAFAGLVAAELGEAAPAGRPSGRRGRTAFWWVRLGTCSRADRFVEEYPFFR